MTLRIKPEIRDRHQGQKQSEEAQETYRRAFVYEYSTPLGEALAAFTDWLRFYTPDIKKRRVWGNGANFDPPILAYAYRAAGHTVPWETAYNVRCHRTLKNLRPTIQIVRSGTHHNAMDDAIDQAFQARGILNDIDGWEEG